MEGKGLALSEDVTMSIKQPARNHKKGRLIVFAIKIKHRWVTAALNPTDLSIFKISLHLLLILLTAERATRKRQQNFQKLNSD
jgi:hypothetical protein